MWCKYKTINNKMNTTSKKSTHADITGIEVLLISPPWGLKKILKRKKEYKKEIQEQIEKNNLTDIKVTYKIQIPLEYPI